MMSRQSTGHRLLVRPDAVQEIPDVVARRVPVDELPLAPQRPRIDVHAAGVARLDPAFIALEPHGATPVPQSAADLQFHAVGVAGRHVPPVQADGLVLHGRRVVRLVGPLADVDGVAAPLRDRAPREVQVPTPEPAGVVAGVVRPPRRRSQPQVPRHLLARRFGLRWKLVDVNVDERRRLLGDHRVNPAQLAGLRQVHGELEVPDAPPLHAALEDAVVTLDRPRQFAALRGRDADGLLAVDVLARLDGQRGGQRMPVVARRDQDGVEVLAGQQVPQVDVLGAVGVAVLLVHGRLGALTASALHVADGHHLHLALLHERAHVIAPAATDTDDAHGDALAGGRAPTRTQRRRRDHRRKRDRRSRRRRALENVPPPHACIPYCAHRTLLWWTGTATHRNLNTH